MSESLKESVPIINGASKGIGKSIALSLAALGSDNRKTLQMPSSLH